MSTVIAILNYLAVELGPDPDRYSDWLTHVSPAIAHQLIVLGTVIELVRQLSGN